MRESFFLRDYQKYLQIQKISTSTVDNYLIDAIMFLKWLGDYLTNLNFTLNAKQPSTFISYLDQQTIFDYQKNLLKHESSPATINRRISGLKKLLGYGAAAGYLTQNLSGTLKNVSLFESKKILAEFKKWLRQNEVTDTTIKNYISDVRHFLQYVKHKSNS